MALEKKALEKGRIFFLPLSRLQLFDLIINVKAKQVTLFLLDQFAWFHKGTNTDHWGKAAGSVSYKMGGNSPPLPSCIWHLFLYSLTLGNPGKMVEVIYGALLWSSGNRRKAQVRPKGFVTGKLGLSGPACFHLLTGIVMQ